MLKYHYTKNSKSWNSFGNQSGFALAYFHGYMSAHKNDTRRWNISIPIRKKGQDVQIAFLMAKQNIHNEFFPPLDQPSMQQVLGHIKSYRCYFNCVG